MSRLPIWVLVVCMLLSMRLQADDAKVENPDEASKLLEGYWTGSWGGGTRDGVVFQPVLAQMLVEKDTIEIAGFRNANALTGTVRVDVAARKIHVTPTHERGQTGDVVEFSYVLRNDRLTLTDRDKVPLVLERHPLDAVPVGQQSVNLTVAERISESGDLQIVESQAVRSKRSGRIQYQPTRRSLKTKQAKLFVTQDEGARPITLDDARSRIDKPTPVVVVYRNENEPRSTASDELVEVLEFQPPDRPEAWQSFSRLLRPGTIIFVLSPRENEPQP